MVTDKDLDRIDKALLSVREKVIVAIQNGQPATVFCEVVLKTGGKVAAAVVGVRENIRME